jgi:hypothetical protein
MAGRAVVRERAVDGILVDEAIGVQVGGIARRVRSEDEQEDTEIGVPADRPASGPGDVAYQLLGRTLDPVDPEEAHDGRSGDRRGDDDDPDDDQ